MTRSAAGLALSLLAACSPGWEDVPGAPINAQVPAAPGHALEWWSLEVQDAADTWAELVGPDCPPPFRYVPGPDDAGMPAHPIRLIAERDWTHGPSVFGQESDAPGGYVDIRSMPYAGRRMILMHELGHAIGLDHRPDVQADALMRVNPSVSIPNPSEIAEARSLICPGGP